MSSAITGLDSVFTSEYLNNSNQTKKLENSLSGDMKEKTEEELMEVCKDFETYFVEQMFKSMQKMVPKDEDSDNRYMDMFGDMLIQEYAKSATKQQDFGLAQSLFEQMKRNYGLG